MLLALNGVFRNKQNEDGMVVINNARLVAQGLTQVEGLDFGETFVPVARLEAIRILLAYACSHNIKLFQMDVKSAFLNGKISELVLLSNLPVLKIQRSQSMYTSSLKLFMVLSKLHELGMKD